MSLSLPVKLPETHIVVHVIGWLIAVLALMRADVQFRAIPNRGREELFKQWSDVKERDQIGERS